MLGLPRTCHMSRILKCLNIYNMEELYISTKLSFLESINNSSVSSDIFRYLCNNKNKRKCHSKSLVQDIKWLESNFHKEISVIFENPIVYKKLLKKRPTIQDGILDSIYSCLNKYKSNTYKKMLDDLTKPDFIREDEEFQELLQYLIIDGYR